jgi:hypothetical protein
MRSNLQLLFAAVALTLLPLLASAKGGDGIVSLKGTIQDASTNADMVTFAFSGKLSFSYFTAPRGDPARKQIDVEFDVKKLPVSIPKFGTSEYDAEDNPFRVSFKNAATHVAEASRSGETVTVALFRPKFSYDISGVLEKLDCTHAQVLADRVVLALRAAGGP